MVVQQSRNKKSLQLSADWSIRRLGELIRIRHGYAFKGEYFSNSGPFVVLTPGNFYDEGGFKDKGDKEKHYIGEVPKDFILKKDDLLVAMTEQAEGLLGSSAIVPSSDYYLHNQRLGLVKEIDPSKTDRKFLYYLFNTRHVRQRIRASASGTKVRHTSPARIYEVAVALPSLRIQRKVAEILSAYDDLIENNARRIKILEEMARSLYREWFVHFRFPGHNKVKLLDNKVPQDWEVRKIGDVIELAYGRALKAEARTGGHVPVFGSSGIIGFHDKPLAKGPGIVVGRKGNVGSVFWTDGDFYAIDTAFFVRTELSLPYVFYNLRHQNFINNDAAVPGLSRRAAYLKSFVVPDLETLKAFEAMVTPIFSQLRVMRENNSNLRRTRDLLLPKLISGEVELR